MLSSEKLYRHAAHVVLVALAVMIVFTFQHYGVTWDEELQSQYGLAVVDYYHSFLQDRRYDDIFNLYLYGGMFDGLASAIDSQLPYNIYETRHLVNAAVGLIGLWGVWRLGRFMGGGAVGLLALMMCALTPMYYGHMFNNPKDIPFAAGIIWSLYYMGRSYAMFPVVSWRLIIKLGVVLGLTLGVRVGGVMLLAFWGAGLLIGVAYKRASIDYSNFTKLIFGVGIIAYLVMLFCWPWAQQSPILNPLRALSEFSNFPQDVEVLLDGTVYRSTQLPWTYVPLYFAVQLPEFLLVLLGLSIVTLPFVVKTLDLPRRQLLIVMLLMGLFPIVYALLRHPALYDAVRHFLFAVPIACVIAAMTAWHLATRAVQAFDRPRSRKIIAASLLLLGAIIIATQMMIMSLLHPYEYIYVNRFAGGVAGAFDRYELDYWASSFKEAAERLQDFVAKEGGVPPGKIYRVAICGSWSSAMIYLPPDYQAVIANTPAEFFISTTRWQCQKMRPGREIIEVARRGAPLAIIKDLRNGYEYYEGNNKERPKQ